MKFGVDVSTYQANVNYDAAVNKGKVEFAILRAGYGRESYQKDDRFEEHYKGFRKYGIPMGAYQYSYARDVAGAKAEAAVMLEWIRGKDFKLPIFYDMEESSVAALGKDRCTEMALAWCEAIEAAGYRAGVYANTNWWRNYLDLESIGDWYVVWCAQWSTSRPSISGVDIWQFGGDTNYIRSSHLEGFGGAVDQNYLLNDSLLSGNAPVKQEKTVEQLAQEVIDGKWGNGDDRKKRLTAAGYSYTAVQSRVNQLMLEKDIDAIAREVIRGEWGNGAQRKIRLVAAGYSYEAVQERVNQLLS